MTEEELLLELKKLRASKPKFHRQFIIFLKRLARDDTPFYISFTTIMTIFITVVFLILYYVSLVKQHPAFLLLLVPPILFSFYKTYEFIRRIE